MTKLIGITGGIGSGKSFVCSIFRKLGVPVYDADIESKQLVNTSKIIKAKLIAHYGNDIYLDSGMLNKHKLSEIIFNNKEDLEKVNNIIHPEVFNNFNTWCKKNSDNNYLIQEAAIMFESGSNMLMDAVIFIDAPEDIRIKRVVERNNVTEQDVKKIIDNQMRPEEKKKLSDYIIINDDKELLLPQIIKLHNIFNN